MSHVVKLRRALLASCLVLVMAGSALASPDRSLGGEGPAGDGTLEEAHEGAATPDVGAIPEEFRNDAVPESGRRSAAASSWREGSATMDTYTSNCLHGYSELLGMAWTGWWGEPGVAPQKNDVYYTKVAWGITGNPCGGGAYTHIEVQLPAHTTLAINSTNKVRCWYKGPDKSNFSEYSGADCPQQPQSGVQGGLAFDPPSTGSYPTATGAAWEVWIPVKTSQPLSGLVTSPPCNSCFTAAVWFIDGWASPWTYPRVGVWVGGSSSNSPAVSYPSPSTINITQTTAKSHGYIFTSGTSGTFTADLGTTKSYGYRTAPVSVPNGDWNAYVDWYDLTPGTIYHWRMCYKPTGGSETCGTDQTFRTAYPPGVPPDTKITSGPSGFTSKTTAKFTFTSTELGSSFECELDGAGFAPCTEAVYSGLSEGKHTFRVRAKDAEGLYDPTPATRTWTIDRKAPQTKITGGPSGSVTSTKATFKFSSSERGTFRCKIDAKKWAKCSSPKSYGSLSRGSHTFRVRAVDRAGNVDASPATRSWTVR